MHFYAPNPSISMRETREDESAALTQYIIIVVIITIKSLIIMTETRKDKNVALTQYIIIN